MGGFLHFLLFIISSLFFHKKPPRFRRWNLGGFNLFLAGSCYFLLNRIKGEGKGAAGTAIAEATIFIFS